MFALANFPASESEKVLRLYAPLTPETAALIALRRRRDQAPTMLLAETNRLEHVRHASVSRSLKAQIASLGKDLAALEAAIAAHIKACETLLRKARLMRTLIGVGARRRWPLCWPTCPSLAA
jgi:transposase